MVAMTEVTPFWMREVYKRTWETTGFSEK
jgi:hypothetical protein